MDAIRIHDPIQATRASRHPNEAIHPIHQGILHGGNYTLPSIPTFHLHVISNISATQPDGEDTRVEKADAGATNAAEYGRCEVSVQFAMSEDLDTHVMAEIWRTRES